MDWESPKLLLLALPALALLLWFESQSSHPMEGLRKRLLLVVRALGIMLALAALAGPAKVSQTGKKALGIILDASQSMGTEGWQKGLVEAQRLQKGMGAGTETFVVMLGDQPALLPEGPEPDVAKFQTEHGGDSQYSAAIDYARA
ncbi:MAG: hypothetical protein OJI67_20895, partial [Prosthecobacter sp.]|nr:hypothetical protein [Prosthecobacter sp.]